MRNILLALGLAWLGTTAALAQPTDTPLLLEAGLSANAYRGDLASRYERWTSAYHLSLHLTRRQRLNGSFQLTVGQVVGQDRRPTFIEDLPEDVTPNNFFTARFFSLHYALAFNILRTDHWRVYVSQGLGFFRFTVRDQRNQDLAGQFFTRAEGETYNNVTATLPTSVGVAYYFDNRYGAGFQAGWLHPATDYLDNISQLGTRSGNDNVASYRFSVWIPLRRKE